MKKILTTLAALTFAASLSITALAQNTTATETTVTEAEPSSALHLAITPTEREDDRGRARTQVVLQRARENPGQYDIAFIGDSITQGWEGSGKTVWEKHYGPRKCINLGVGGDRTQHVLWRFEQGQLKGIKPKAVVLMIGTNNSNREDHTEAQILEGVTTIVDEIRGRLPETKIILVGIFPRGQTFSVQRGKILQVNQALARQEDGKNVFYVDLGSKLIEDDGSISKAIMPDYLHLTQKGYEIWAESLEPLLKKLGV